MSWSAFPPFHLVEQTGPSPHAAGPGWLLKVEDWPLPASGLAQLERDFSDLAGRLALLERAEPGSVAELMLQLAAALLHPETLSVAACTSGRTPQQPWSVLHLSSLQHRLAGRALRFSRDLVLSLACLQERIPPARRQEPQLLEARARQLESQLRPCCDHTLTRAQLRVAQARGIPSFCVLPDHRILQLGSGCHGHFISSSSNDSDSSIGVHICSRKDLSAELLRDLGLPTPRELRLEVNCGVGRLRRAAQLIGYPCVIKPVDGEQGRGVTARIANDQELLAAFQRARAQTRRGILLQNHVSGHDHRLVVIGGHLAWAVRREAPTIVGDGERSVRALIEAANQLRRELRQIDGISGSIDLDSDLLERLKAQGMELASVPPAEMTIVLRANANVSTGALSTDVSDRVHPRLRQQVESLAATLRLDALGVDYLLDDVSQDPTTSTATIIELNSMPQATQKRAEVLLDNLFPAGTPHSIPCLVVTCPLASTSSGLQQQLIQQAMARAPQAVLACPTALLPSLAGLAQRMGWPLRGYSHPRELLLDASCKAVIFIADLQDLNLHGLPVAAPQQLIALLPPQLAAQDTWRDFFRRLPCQVVLGTAKPGPEA